MFSRSTVVNLHPSSSPAHSLSVQFYLSPAGPKNALPPLFSSPPSLPPFSPSFSSSSSSCLLCLAGPVCYHLPPAVRAHKGQPVCRVISLGWSWTLTPRVLDVFQTQTGRYAHKMDMCGPARACFLCGHFWSIHQFSFVANSSPSGVCLGNCAIEWLGERRKKKEPLTTTSVWRINISIINASMHWWSWISHWPVCWWNNLKFRFFFISINIAYTFSKKVGTSFISSWGFFCIKFRLC